MKTLGRWLGVLAALAVAAGAATWSLSLLYEWATAAGSKAFPVFAVFLLVLVLVIAWLVNRIIGLALFPVTLAAFGAGLIIWPGWGSAAGLLVDCFFDPECAIDNARIRLAALALFSWQPFPQGLVLRLIGLSVIGIAAAVDYGRQGFRLGALAVKMRKPAGRSKLDTGGYRLSVFLTVSNDGRADISVEAAGLSAAWLFCETLQTALWAGESRNPIDADAPARIAAGAVESIDVSFVYVLRKWVAPDSRVHRLAAASGLLRSAVRLTTSSRTLYSPGVKLA